MATHSVDISEKIVENINISSIEEKRLLTKLDLRIIPLLTLLFTLSFLDRVNIGNAKLAHLERDLNLTGDQFNWCLAIFFLGYVVFEVPSNIMLIKIRPSIWISTLTVGWGITMICMAFVKNFSQLMGVRFLLGVFESGLFPGIIFYITKWYKRSERGYRISLFFSGATIAGAFNGLLAFAITKLDGRSGLSGWQWIFLIDGIATVIAALFSYFLISDYAETATWLTEDERKLAIDRLRIDGGHAHTTHFDKFQIFQAFKDLLFPNFFPLPHLFWDVFLVILGYALLLANHSSIACACIVGLGFFSCIPTLLA
ncbi:17685_t:CDS:2, partial [Cetraspora pellucida]